MKLKKYISALIFVSFGFNESQAPIYITKPLTLGLPEQNERNGLLAGRGRGGGAELGAAPKPRPRRRARGPSSPRPGHVSPPTLPGRLPPCLARPWATSGHPPALDPAMHREGGRRSQVGARPVNPFPLTRALALRRESLRQGRVPTAALLRARVGAGRGAAGADAGRGRRQPAKCPRGASFPL